MRFEIRRYEVGWFRVCKIDEKDNVVFSTTVDVLKVASKRNFLFVEYYDKEVLKEMYQWVQKEYPELLL